MARMLARQAHDEHNPAQFIVTTFHPQVPCSFNSCEIWNLHAWLQIQLVLWYCSWLLPFSLCIAQNALQAI